MLEMVKSAKTCKTFKNSPLCLIWAYYYPMKSLDVNRTVSPRDMASAIGMSESSLKRWADNGLLTFTRTGGGHRRIRIHEAIRFIRERSIPIQSPSAIGLPVDFSTTRVNPDNEVSLLDMFKRGATEEAESFLMSRYLGGASIAQVGDEDIRPVLESLGHVPHNSEGILREHCATQVCLQSIERMRVLARSPDPKFHALGGAIGGDIYMLPTLLVSSVIEELGGRAVNLGANTPTDAIRWDLSNRTAENRPDLVWVSVSHFIDEDEQVDDLLRLGRDCHDSGMSFFVGGRALVGPVVDRFEGFDVHSSLCSISESLASASFC